MMKVKARVLSNVKLTSDFIVIIVVYNLGDGM